MNLCLGSSEELRFRARSACSNPGITIKAFLSLAKLGIFSGLNSSLAKEGNAYSEIMILRRGSNEDSCVKTNTSCKFYPIHSLFVLILCQTWHFSGLKQHVPGRRIPVGTGAPGCSWAGTAGAARPCRPAGSPPCIGPGRRARQRPWGEIEGAAPQSETAKKCNQYIILFAERNLSVEE